MKRTLLTSALVLVPSMAIAHPGHGVVGSNSFVHWLADHPALTAAAVLAVGFAWWMAAKVKDHER